MTVAGVGAITACVYSRGYVTAGDRPFAFSILRFQPTAAQPPGLAAMRLQYLLAQKEVCGPEHAHYL
jgi:hypothetical protein